MKPDLARLLDVLYSSARQPEAINDFLDLLCLATDSHAASVCASQPSGTGGPLLDWTGIPAQAATSYAERYADQNIWIQKTVAQQYMGNVIVADDWVSNQELRTSTYWREFLRLIDVDHCAAVCGGATEAQVFALNIVRSSARGAYDGDHVDLLRKLSPHWVNLCSIQSRLGVLGTHSTASEAALERVSSAAYFLDASGAVVWMNHQGERLARRSVLHLRNSHLTCPCGHDSRILEKAIAACVRLAEVCAERLAYPVPIHDIDGRLIAFANVRTFGIPRPIFGTAKHAAAAVFVTLRRPESKSLLDIALRNLFGLTPSECAIAIALQDVSNVRNAASQAGVSYDTARTRLKIILEKTGEHSKEGLATMISTLWQTIGE